MTDRYSTLIVVLESDIRDDDAEGILSAIRLIRGVLTVSGNVADSGAYLAEERAKADLRKTILELLRKK